MIILSNGDLITQHFDIFGNECILDLPIENGWQLRYYKNHKLIEVDEW